VSGSDAYQLLGMAEIGLVPAVFARKSRHGTPTVATSLSFVVIIALALSSSFERIIMVRTARPRLVDLSTPRHPAHPYITSPPPD
jgi:hypothetical protein